MPQTFAENIILTITVTKLLMISRTKVVDDPLLKFTSFHFLLSKYSKGRTAMRILVKVILAPTSHLFMIAAKSDILHDDENDSQRLTFSWQSWLVVTWWTRESFSKILVGSKTRFARGKYRKKVKNSQIDLQILTWRRTNLNQYFYELHIYIHIDIV